MLPDKIFGLFYMYGLMIAVGILACFGVIFYYGKKKKIEEKFIDFIFYNAIASIVVGFGVAALFQATYNYIENPKAGFNLGGGITFIGGLIGGVACFLIIYAIFRKRYKTKLYEVLSMTPCAILIAHAFGRIGCLFAGCCHGPKTDAWFGIYMHTSEYGYAKVVPVQLFEAIFLFLLFAVCFILLMKKDFKHNMSVYLIAYGIFRFCIEFLRADERGELFAGISPSQFWSILMVIAGVGVYFLVRWLYKKNPPTIEQEETEKLSGEEMQQ